MTPTIPGLQYIPNYISNARKSALIQIIDNAPWILDLKRRTQHYGYKYDYTKRMITEDLYLGPLPDWLMFFTKKLHIDGIFTQTPDQVVVCENLIRSI